MNRRSFLSLLGLAPVVPLIAESAKAAAWRDGQIVILRNGGTSQGTISINGSTNVYGTFCGKWADVPARYIHVE